MVNCNVRFEYNTKPPNSIEAILKHPSGNGDHIELALFNEHRFALYYWAKWYKGKFITPDLINFDWHYDLGKPEDETKKKS